MQEVKVIARTFESQNENEQDTAKMNEELAVFSGKAAGVCYMAEDYLEAGIQDAEKALTRVKGNAKSGHHSVAGHATLSFSVKTNKMMMMLLNSIGLSCASEKSARYTKMQPETDKELELYNKWRNIIREMILERYPKTDDAMLNTRFKKFFSEAIDSKAVNDAPVIIDGEFANLRDDEYKQVFLDKLAELKTSDTLPSCKLAQENARYMISVFTPTTAIYSLAFREVFYLIDHLKRLEENTVDAQDVISKKLNKYAEELREQFEKAIGESRIHDNKNQYFRLLENQYINEVLTEDPSFIELDEAYKAKEEVIGDAYTIVHYDSLAALAQQHRHRTLRYSMMIKYVGQYGYFIPPIVEAEGMAEEWLDDISSIRYCVPQGTIVRITEQGLFEDFVLKCKERMCGRAQLETMRATTLTVRKFFENRDKLSKLNQNLLDGIVDEDGNPKARCLYSDFVCSEGCQWGYAKALTRLI